MNNNDNICSTVQCIGNNKNSKKRCKNKIDKKKSLLCTHHTLFCGTINEKIKQDINTHKIDANEYLIHSIKNKVENNTVFLNELHKHNLLSLKESWNDVYYYKRLYIDNYWWDLDILTEHIYYLLNSSSMGNPKPQFPCNPFTLSPISHNGLNIYFKKLIYHKISVNIIFKIFYDNIDVIINTNKNEVHCKLTEIFKNNCRYKLINTKDSQNCYIGFWVDKTLPFTEFENMHKLLQNTSPQLIVNNYNGVNQIIDNPRISQITSCLNKMKPENITIVNDYKII